jgi:hypothetical protein
MFTGRNKLIVFALLAISSFVAPNFAQKAAVGDGTASQRLEVMRQKLETMRRSLNSAASVLKEENKDDKAKKDDKANANTPLGRLRGLEKESSALQSEINSLRGKIDRSEKYENSDVDQLEQRVSELNASVDAVLLETATARANPGSDEGKPREIKKKKKFLGIFGGGGTDEYEELIGSVTPGRDREFFIVATREIRKTITMSGAFTANYHYDLPGFGLSADGKTRRCRLVLFGRLY